MAMHPGQRPPPADDWRPQLRLVSWETESEESQASDGERLSPRMTLSEFFEAWFLPVVLRGEHDASASTITLYRETIAWWKRLTHDPPLALIDQVFVARFAASMREATYTRGPGAKARPLGAFTVTKHLRNLRAILYRLGRTRDERRPTAEIVDRALAVRVQVPQAAPKVPFTLAMARRAAAAAELMEGPRWADVPPGAWWRALLATLFYTGLRAGTVLRLRWDMVRQEGRAGTPWLDVPAGAVPKTKKAVRRSVHPLLWEAWQPLRDSSELLVPYPHHYTHFVDQHDQLQAAAGIPAEERLSPQAWRRTHAVEMARLGAKHATQVARRAMDHADDRTTTSFYADIENELLMQLPKLWDVTDDDPRQLKLF